VSEVPSSRGRGDFSGSNIVRKSVDRFPGEYSQPIRRCYGQISRIGKAS